MNIRLLKTDNYFIAGFWCMFGLLFLLQVFPQTESILETVCFTTLLLGFIYLPASYLSNTLLNKALQSGKMKPFIFQFATCSLVVGGIMVSLIHLFFFLEKNNVFPESSYFDVSTLPYYSNAFIAISAGVFINLSLCGLRFLLEYVKSQKTMLEYQLKTLQHQVTPHFMFNVLNHIHVLMQTDIELASSLLIKYSEILRYQLYNGEKERVTLKQEIQYLEDFITVEQLRWEGKLTVVHTWDVENEELEIPPLLFITFVENAFKHVAKSTLENGFIRMGLEQKEGSLCFEIENSKSKIEKKKKRKGLGLKNIQERLELLFHNQSQLRLEETDELFRVHLCLNLPNPKKL